MIDEPNQELVIQFLLGELDSSQEAAIRARLDSDAELQDFASEMEQTFAALAQSAPPMQPPPDLPQRILRHERGRSAAARSKLIWVNFVPWVLAACLAIICGVLAVERVKTNEMLTATRQRSAQLEQQLAALRTKQADSERELASLRSKESESGKEIASLREQAAQSDQNLASLREKQSAAEKELTSLRQQQSQSQQELADLRAKNVLSQLQITTLQAQVASYRKAVAVVVWDKDQKSGVLQLDNLPPPAAGKDYQLWVIDPKKPQPVSAGVVAVPSSGLIRASFRPTGPVESVGAFAISVEKAGGSPEPKGQIILVGK